MNTNYMSFTTIQGESLRIDATVANNTLLIGTTTSRSAYKLYVNGPAWTNSLASSGAIATTGSVGAGTDSPESSLHVAGAIASTYNYAGVQAGMIGSLINPLISPRLTFVTDAFPTAGSGALSWSRVGYTTSQYDFQILGDHNAKKLTFSTVQGTGLTIDGSVANNTVIIGPIGPTGSSPYRFYVGGNSLFDGSVRCTSLSSGNPKTFDIVHPLEQSKRLRHRCLESPKAINLYRYTVECVLGENLITLPGYFDVMNEGATVHVAAANCFGLGYGFCNGNVCTVVVNAVGTYHVHVYGDRADQAAQDEFAKYGTEYDPLLVNATSE
jgi:hypothetical protein